MNDDNYVCCSLERNNIEQLKNSVTVVQYGNLLHPRKQSFSSLNFHGVEWPLTNQHS